MIKSKYIYIQRNSISRLVAPTTVPIQMRIDQGRSKGNSLNTSLHWSPPVFIVKRPSMLAELSKMVKGTKRTWWWVGGGLATGGDWNSLLKSSSRMPKPGFQDLKFPFQTTDLGRPLRLGTTLPQISSSWYMVLNEITTTTGILRFSS